MFKSATIKLTIFYTLAITAVCIVFTISIYGLASNDVDKEAQRRARVIQELNDRSTTPARPTRPGAAPPPINEEIQDQIRDQIESDRNQLLFNILLVDALIVFFGAIGAYFVAKRTLEPINKTMEKQRRFSADASHELRTPLTVMKAEIDVALQQNLKAPELKEVLESNLEEVERLATLADQLLTLTSVEDNSINLEKINATSLISNYIDDFNTKNKTNVQTDIDDNVYVLGDLSLLETYARILLENALKYSDVDAPFVKVSLKKENSSKCALIIENNGIGIEREDLDRIFDRFYRTNNAKASGKNGHGLGLSLASEIAKKHGSRVHVESVPGQFTKFSILLKCV